MPATAPDPELEAFHWHLRVALNHLYEPRILRASPLLALFDLAGNGQGVAALQRVLTGGIEALRPAADTPPGSGAWRAYHILRRRYTEQVPQAAAALDMGLSVRHMQREEKQARELLAAYLWATHHLNDRRGCLSAAAPPPAADGDEAPISRSQELAWLQESDRGQVTDLAGLVQRSLETAAPLLRELALVVDNALPAGTPAGLPPAWVRPILLEQGLIGVITLAAENAAGGRLKITGVADGSQLAVTLEAPPAPSGGGSAGPPRIDGLDMAHELIRLAGGELALDEAETWPEQGPRLTLRLPQVRQATVLLVDDNADALQLLQRHLAGTHYRPVAVRDAGQAIAVAEEVCPEAILLDVMMPGRDGWALLGQLRVHPRLQAVPVVICTVLSQERLARTLGAAEFLRKPVSRATLLATLERLLPPPQTPAS